MQVGASQVHLRHAFTQGIARLRQLRRHLGKRTGQLTELVSALKHRFGAQIPSRHIAHTLGQQQQWPRQLVAQEHGQQHRAKDRQKQGQGQGSDVHPAQALPRQSTLLVFAVGQLHRQRIGDQIGRQGLGDLQNPVFIQQAQARCRHDRQHLHPRTLALTGHTVL